MSVRPRPGKELPDKFNEIIERLAVQEAKPALDKQDRGASLSYSGKVVGRLTGSAEPVDGASWGFLTPKNITWTRCVTNYDTAVDGNVIQLPSNGLYLFDWTTTPKYTRLGQRAPIQSMTMSVTSEGNLAASPRHSHSTTVVEQTVVAATIMALLLAESDPSALSSLKVRLMLLSYLQTTPRTIMHPAGSLLGYGNSVSLGLTATTISVAIEDEPAWITPESITVDLTIHRLIEG